MQKSSQRQVDGHVRYTTQETLSTLTGETDNLEKGLASMQQQFKALQKMHGENKQAVLARLETRLGDLKKENVLFKELWFKNRLSISVSVLLTIK